MKDYIGFEDAIVFEEVVSSLICSLHTLRLIPYSEVEVRNREYKLKVCGENELYETTILYSLPLIKKIFGDSSKMFNIGLEDDAVEELRYNLFVLSSVAMLTFNEYNYKSIDCNQTAERMISIYRKKNADYGNSFDQSLDEDGLLVAKIRIGDKVRRFLSLTKEGVEVQVKEESISDTLLDLANYCVMTIVYINNHKN